MTGAELVLGYETVKHRRATLATGKTAGML
jgi:hypothetical protein